ncbi:hypothetical protein KOR42_48690 [Thalassoglobus neptunius]|uniref:Uncharacterized protein n=1 Tax=Thalassoglobus neptunius TaxID=1938619 RepID=A0A5C5VQ35_9PLAN|nr:hypothetical protein [Thalassoglobus neptunius]TWT40726.1 hypothetical protein KOR42_48690 [Thalassoglobus neptunius]
MHFDPQYLIPLDENKKSTKLCSVEREKLVEAIELFLTGNISAFDFDEALDPFRRSSDPIVRIVAEEMWYFYDDLDDHYVAMTKQEWGYVQRLLLLLKSNCEIVTPRKRIWSWTQLVAAASVITFVVISHKIDWGAQLFVLSIPFGIVSILLSRLGRNQTRILDAYTAAIHPFASFGDLREAYESVQFLKTPYPQEMNESRIRTPSQERFLLLQLHVYWLLFAPIPLTLQMFPHQSLSKVRTIA